MARDIDPDAGYSNFTSTPLISPITIFLEKIYNFISNQCLRAMQSPCPRGIEDHSLLLPGDPLQHDIFKHIL